MAELIIVHNRRAVYDRSDAESIKRLVLPRQIRRRQRGVINQRPPRPVQRFDFALLGGLSSFGHITQNLGNPPNRNPQKNSQRKENMHKTARPRANRNPLPAINAEARMMTRTRDDESDIRKNRQPPIHRL